MVKELVFHIGDHKTGSTSIQTALARRSYRIEGLSVHYATDRPDNNFMVEPLMGLRPDPATARPRFARHAGMLDASDADVGVLSAEHVENIDPTVFDTMLRETMPHYRDRLRLILYLRPHADRFISNFVELCKLGRFDTRVDVGMVPFYEWARRDAMLDYAPRVAHWHEVFGERLIVRPFVRERLAGNDVVHDFFDVLGGGRPVTLDADAAARRNPSVSAADLALLRHVQIRLRKAFRKQPKLLWTLGHSTGWALATLLNGRPGRDRTPVRLHAELGRRLQADCQADADELDRRWFEEAPMATALDTASARFVETPQSFLMADHFDAETIRQTDIWCDMLAAMIRVAPQKYIQATHTLNHPPAPATAPG